MRQKCSLVDKPVRVTQEREVESEDKEEEAEARSPKKPSSVKKVMSSIKGIFSGSESGKSPEKAGALVLPPSIVPVNRAEVVLNTRHWKEVSADESDLPPPSLTLSDSIRMGPPHPPSVQSVQTQTSRYDRSRETYEIMQLREDLRTSQEELALFRESAAHQREISDARIRDLEEQLESHSGESSGFWKMGRGKGKGKERE